VESNHLPLGYRPRPSPFGLACLVRPRRIELRTSAMSRRRSATELRTRTPAGIRTPDCRPVKPMPSASWRRERMWCAEQDSNLHCAGFEAAASYRLGYQRVPVAGIEPALDRRLRPGLYLLGYTGKIGAPGGIRTHTVHVLSVATPAFGLPARAPCKESNLLPSAYKAAALPFELTGQMDRRRPSSLRRRRNATPRARRCRPVLKRLAMSKNRCRQATSLGTGLSGPLRKQKRRQTPAQSGRSRRC
jgi:hypothetical protein